MNAKKAPEHLRESTRRWWQSVMREYELSPHHLHLLKLACEALDQAEAAREIIEKEGLVLLDRFGQRVSHPAARVEKDSRLQFSMLLKQLALDDDAGLPAATQRVHTPRRGRV